jgi:carbamoyl-phosphate synthase large subunit
MKKKILISAANGPIMKSLIIELKKRGFYVVGIDSSKIGVAQRFCNEFYHSPIGSSLKFLQFIKKIANKFDVGFLYVDEELENLSKNIRQFPILEKKIIISPRKTIKICNNKKLFNDFFKNKKSINLPSNNFIGKNIIKPIVGRGSKNIFTCSDKNIINIFKKNIKYIVQEYISGTEYTVDCVFDKNGTLIFGLSRKRILSQNVSIVGKVVKHKKLLNIIKKISTYLKFYGPINFQFIENKKGIWLIEINPRLSGSVIFTIKSGFDPVNLSYQIHTKNKIILPRKINYKETHFRFWES